MGNQAKQENKLNKNGNRRGMHPNTQKNIIGNHNKNGRPRKDQSLLDYIRKKLPEICEYDAKRRTWLEALAEAEMRQALNDVSARRDLFDRLLGKPVQPIGGEEGGEIIFRVKYDNKD